MAKEKARVAELLTEKAMLQKKVALQAAEEELELEIKIAKSQARQKAFSEFEANLLENGVCFSNSPRDNIPLKSSDKHSSMHAEFASSPLCKDFDYNPAVPLHASSPKHLEQNSHPEKNPAEGGSSTLIDSGILQYMMAMQQKQNQHMVTSQQQLAAIMTLPQPQVPKFNGDPIEYKTFIMACRELIANN